MKKAFSMFLITAAVVSASSGFGADKIIFRVRNISTVSLEEIAADMRTARIALIGESHSNASHHQAQLQVIQSMHEAGLQVAVGFEMFRQDAQPGLDRWVSGELSEADFKNLYSDNWDRNLWPLYIDIFRYARDHELPMIGLNVNRSVVRQISRNGFGSLSAEQKEEIGLIACNVEARYRDVLRRAFGGKNMSEKVFSNFCEAQVVWDTVMANRAVDYAKANPESIIVILAGTMHAWKYGIPQRIEQQSDLPHRVILPSNDKSFLNYDIALQEADYVMWSE